VRLVMFLCIETCFIEKWFVVKAHSNNFQHSAFHLQLNYK